MGGDSMDVVSMVDFWIGGVDQRSFGLSTAAPSLINQTVSSSQGLCDCLDSITPKAIYKVKQSSKHSNSCNKVETLVHSTGGNNATEIY